MHSRLLLAHGRVIDPSQQLDRVTNLLIEDGRIAAYDVSPRGDEQVIDVAKKIVAPGLIDLHTQLREPGCEEDETIETGTAAALSGGYTSICCLPETEPPIDTPAGVEFVKQKAARAGNCHVFPIACISRNREGEQLAEIGSLVEAGAAGFSDASRSIENSDLLRRALEYCQMFNRPILHFPEVTALSRGGVMHEGRVSLVLGLGGMPSEAEDVMVGRDSRLTEATQGRLHLLAVSSIGSMEVIRRVKTRGANLTAGVCIWNLVFTDERLKTFNPHFKVNPPLRSPKHIEACQQALRDGTLDVISSGHSPRAAEKKMQEIDEAPFGMTSLETTLSLTIQYLVHPGILTWSQAIDKLSCGPARVMGLEKKGTLRVGADADVTVIDPDRRWRVTAAELRSRSANTPLLNEELTGRASHVIVAGSVKISR
jgi:dihydroorotase